MTQDKEILLKDLCARLPYGIKCEYKDEVYDILGIAHGRLILCKPLMSSTLKDCPLVEEVTPYLFPLSSLTDEQKDDMIKSSCGIGSDKNVFDWYNKNHFDYRNLINKNLAIDCTNLNIY